MGKPSMTPAKRSLLLALHRSDTGLLRAESPGRWTDGRSKETWFTGTVKALGGGGLVRMAGNHSAVLTPAGRAEAARLAAEEER